MEWLQSFPNLDQQIAECIESEQYRFSIHFNALLGKYKLPRIWVLDRLKQGRRKKDFDYVKGKDEIPCFCFVARKTAEMPALVFFVAFAKESDDSVVMWIQEFHTDTD